MRRTIAVSSALKAIGGCHTCGRIGYSFLATLVLGFLIRFTIGFRASADAEHGGLDLHQHAETGYDITAGRGGLAADATPPTGVPLQRTASDQRLTAPVRVEHPKRYP